MDILVNIDVSDLGEATRLYTAALDLHASRRLGTSGVELSGGSSKVCLLCAAEGSQPCSACTGPHDYGRRWTPVHVDFAVSDIHASVARTTEAGALQEGPISDLAWGRLALMSAPFGNGFCLVQFLGNGYTEIAT